MNKVIPMRFPRRCVGLYISVVLASFSQNANALNYHELEVYPYQTPSQGETEFEVITAYTRRGTQQAAPPDNNRGLWRQTFELAHGVTDKTEIAGYLDFSRARGSSDWNFVASRWRLRSRLAEKGQWPVDLGWYVEAEIPHQEDNNVELELRGILEKDVGLWTFNLNPIFEKVAKGVDKDKGWEFQYAAAIVYRWNERWHPRLDFFGDFGPARNFEAKKDQKHLISPGVDLKFGRGFLASFGVAFGRTEASEQQILRAKFEWEFH